MKQIHYMQYSTRNHRGWMHELLVSSGQPYKLLSLTHSHTHTHSLSITHTHSLTHLWFTQLHQTPKLREPMAQLHLIDCIGIHIIGLRWILIIYILSMYLSISFTKQNYDTDLLSTLLWPLFITILAEFFFAFAISSATCPWPSRIHSSSLYSHNWTI